MKETVLTHRLGNVLHLYTFEPNVEAKGIVLLVHGAGEHARKYDEFANYLTENGFYVVSYDQFGHGKSKLLPDRVVFAKENGDALLLDGLVLVHEYASGIQPSLPIFVIAHSMGTFLVRALMTTRKDLFDGHILIGSSVFSPLKIKLALLTSKWIMKFKGYDYISSFMTSQTQDKPYKSMKKRGLIHERHEWVTSDITRQKLLKSDTLSNAPFTISAQSDIFKLMLKAQAYNELKKTANGRLVHIICGEEDALCNYGEGIKKLYGLYFKSGFTNLNYKVYPNVRHELLNEINRDEVMGDILEILIKET
ncbi:MAG: alpha/beta fold hydrolase [Candidatus Izemoplasmataceae bacterium]|jgi:alpha-beta hydrolase superfamily lysophospholipase